MIGESVTTVQFTEDLEKATSALAKMPGVKRTPERIRMKVARLIMDRWYRGVSSGVRDRYAEDVLSQDMAEGLAFDLVLWLLGDTDNVIWWVHGTDYRRDYFRYRFVESGEYGLAWAVMAAVWNAPIVYRKERYRHELAQIQRAHGHRREQQVPGLIARLAAARADRQTEEWIWINFSADLCCRP